MSMTNPGYRALCAELVEAYAYLIDRYMTAPSNKDALVYRARTAVNQPEPVAPTDEELIKTYCDARRAFYFEAAEGESDQEDRKAATIAGLRAVLTKWSTPANNTGGTH